VTAPHALPWKSGVTARIVSSGVSPSRSMKCGPLVPVRECVKSTPFGLPVVPDV
jgi:hypothetical protein